MNSLTARHDWSKVVEDEYRRRVELVIRLAGSEQDRTLVLRYLSQDRPEAAIAFARDFVFTLDPRNQPPDAKTIPFTPWPKQEELLRAIWIAETTRTNLTVEKSRDTGVTVLILGAYYVWRWLFFREWVGGVGSRKAALLDRKGDPSTAFAKVRQTIKRLPTWMLPVGYDERQHDNYARIINPATDAVIAGEAGDEQGRGGRSSLYLLDEFGKMQRPASVESAVAGNADSILYVSTATPVGTYFHRLVSEGRTDVFRLHWRDDPRKDDEWYARFARKFGPVITALEVDIDYEGASNLSFIPYQYVAAAIEAFTAPTDATPAQHVAGFDVAGGGSAEHVYIARTGTAVTTLEAWSGGDPTDACNYVASYARRDSIHTIYFDMVGVGAGAGTTLDTLLDTTITTHGINTGNAPENKYLPDNSDADCSTRFANYKAQLWWQLRLRFQNTFNRFQNGDESISLDDCISIPEDSTLIAQLVTPRMTTNASGKVAVESKESLSRRGAVSPDRADALVLCFASPRYGADATVRVLGQQVNRHDPLRARARLTSIASNRRRP
jgi:phage terminase large subunit